MGSDSQQDVSAARSASCAPSLPPAQQTRCPSCHAPRKLLESVCANCGHSDAAKAPKGHVEALLRTLTRNVESARCKGGPDDDGPDGCCWRHARTSVIAARLLGLHLRAEREEILAEVRARSAAARRRQDRAAVASCVDHAVRHPRRDVVAWLAHDLYFSGLACNGGECDLGAPCLRHGNLFRIADRLLRLRARRPS